MANQVTTMPKGRLSSNWLKQLQKSLISDVCTYIYMYTIYILWMVYVVCKWVC